MENWDRIFQRIQEKVADKCPNVTQTFEVTPSALPVLLVDCRGKIDQEEAFDMEEGSQASKMVIELTAYASGEEKLKTVREIMKLADEEMRSMIFQRTDGPKQVTETEDSAICRYTALYERVFAEGELV